MTEELIELIRQHTVLYDHTCKEYKNLSVRNAAWENIAEALNEPVDKCRDDWTKLRNAFASVLKRRRRKKGTGPIMPWKYEENLNFLLPYMSVLVRDCKPSTQQDLFVLMKPVNELKPKKEELRCPGADLDETDLFFMAMSKALKALPKMDQTKIKLDLHTAISQAELRQINQREGIMIVHPS